jgi:hypothetical protein
MSKTLTFAALLLATMPIVAVPAYAGAPHSTSAAYSVKETSLGTMLDDPASRAIIARFAPDIIGHPQVQMARSLTLVQLQGFAGDMLADPVLASIDAALRKAAPKR